jgi:hypothetical protein
MDVLISPDALGKQAQLAYEGKAYKMLLAYRNGEALTQASLMSAWNAVKLPAGNGYTEKTGTIGTGSWNSGNARYELPQFTMTITATGSGITYDAVLLQVDNRTYPDRVVLLPTPETLQSGQSKAYVLLLAQG